ncbi:MAG: hypothetical protein O3C40_25040 [Planctomycetota bacterium]|nr:hypothetical protein [Planctomycetota bacterium]
MDLELATTEDMLTELKRRQTHFVFIGCQNPNVPESEVVYAYQGTSRRELCRMLRFVLKRLLQQDPDDRT